jgi:hypothetical protein
VGVWSPFADRLVFKLIGHGAPLVGVQFVQGTPQIVSADVQGWIKVWDTRNFSCVQTFMSSERITSFTTCGSYHRRIIVAGRMKQWLCYDQEGGPHMAYQEADDPAFNCIFNPTTTSFATISRRDVKIWNALNGRLSRIYRGLSDSEVTAACLDGRQRKLIIGDQAGKIRVFNYQTGSYMKSLQAHDGEVSYLGYCHDDRTVVSVGKIDRCIKLHDERPIEDQHVLFTVCCPHEVTATAFSESLRLIAAAGMDGNIYLWRLGKGVVEGQCKGRGEQILSLCFLQDYPLLIAGDQSGEVTIWVVPHITAHGTRSHNDASHGSSGGNSAAIFTGGVTSSTAHCVRAMAFMNKGPKRGPCAASAFALDNARLRLYTGDLEGDIHVWDLKQVLVWVDADRGGRTGLIRSLHQSAAAAAATASSSSSSSAGSSSSSSSSSVSVPVTTSGAGPISPSLPAGSLVSSTLSSMRSNAIYGHRGSGTQSSGHSRVGSVSVNNVLGSPNPTTVGGRVSFASATAALSSSSAPSSGSNASTSLVGDSSLLTPLLSPNMSRKELKDQIKNWCRTATPTFSILNAHPSPVSTLELTKEPACLISSARHHRVCLWSPDSGRPMGSLDSAHGALKHEHKSHQLHRQERSDEWLFKMDMAKREEFDQRLNADLFTVLDKEKEDDLAVVTLLEKMQAEKDEAENKRIDESRAEWAKNMRPLTTPAQHGTTATTTSGTAPTVSTSGDFTLGPGRLHAMSFAETDSHRDGGDETDGELLSRLMGLGSERHHHGGGGDDSHRTGTGAGSLARSSSAMSDHTTHRGEHKEHLISHLLGDIKEEDGRTQSTSKRSDERPESRDDAALTAATGIKLPALPPQSLSPPSRPSDRTRLHAERSTSDNNNAPTNGGSPSPPPVAADSPASPTPTVPQWKAPNARRGSVITLQPMFPPTPIIQPAPTPSVASSTLASINDDIISNKGGDSETKSNLAEPPPAPVGLSPGTATGARPGTDAIPMSVPRSSHSNKPILVGIHNPVDEEELAQDRQRQAIYDAALQRLDHLNMPFRPTVDYVGAPRAGTDEEDEHAWRTHFIARKTNPFANAGKSRGLAEQLAHRLRQREIEETEQLRQAHLTQREAERYAAQYGSGSSTPGVLSLPSTADGRRTHSADGHLRRDSTMSTGSTLSNSADATSRWQEDDDETVAHGGGGLPRSRTVAVKGEKTGKFSANHTGGVAKSHHQQHHHNHHNHHNQHSQQRRTSLGGSSSMPSLLSTLSTGVVIPGVGMTLTSVPSRRLSHQRSFSRANADLLTSPVFTGGGGGGTGGPLHSSASNDSLSGLTNQPSGILTTSGGSSGGTPHHRSAGHTRGASVTFAHSVTGGDNHTSTNATSPSRSRRASLNKQNKDNAFPADGPVDGTTATGSDGNSSEVKEESKDSKDSSDRPGESPEVRELREALLAHKIATAGNEALSNAHRTGFVGGK